MAPDQTPGRKPRVVPSDVLELFDEREDRGEPLTAPEIADELNCDRKTAYNKLQRLEDSDDVASKKVGGRSRVYWIPILNSPTVVDDVVSSQSNRADRDVQDGDAPAGQPGQSPDDATDLEAGREADTGLSTRPDDVGDPIGLDALIDDVATGALPGSGSKLEERSDALHAVVDYLREHGAAEPKHFQEDVYPDHTAGYTSGKNPAYSWWTNCIYKGLRELSDRTDVVGKADTTGEWTYQGSGDR